MNNYMRNIDLNLLSIFIAVMREKNLSHAATNLGMSQPAVSQALKRLRAVYNDPLFERQGGKMMPTLKAESISPIIEDILSNVNLTLPDTNSFDPLNSRENFHINILGVENSFMLTELASQFARQAPLASLTISNEFVASPERSLREKEFDLHLDYMPLESNDCYHHALFEDNMFIVARKGHPRLQNMSSLSLEHYLNETHAVLRPRANNVYPIQSALTTLELNRDIKYTSSNFDSIINVIRVTDHLAVIPGVVIDSLPHPEDYVWFKPPFETASGRAFMNWHWSMEYIKSHNWLRQLMKQICEKYQPKTYL